MMAAGRGLTSLGQVCENPVLSRISPGAGKYPGLAALSYLADHGVAPAQWCLRVDPVGLDVGTAGLFLRTGQLPGLGEAEMRELATAAAQVLESSGLQLELSSAGHWYLLSPAPLGGGLKPPWEAEGENLLDAWTEGDVHRTLSLMVNEIQVVFHQHEINRRRRSRGLPAINFLWPWGGGPGAMPALRMEAEIWSDGEAMAAGLAAAAGLPCGRAENLAGIPRRRGRSLLCWLSGEGGREARWAALEQGWLAPLRDRWLVPSRFVLCGLDGEGVELRPLHWWAMKLGRTGARTKAW